MITDIITTLQRTATPLEWAYTVGALITVLILLYLTALASRDRDVQIDETIRNRTQENTAALTDARGRVEIFTYKSAIALVIFGMGLDFMFTPPANPHQPITPAGIILALSLMAIEILLLLLAVRSYRIRVLAIRQYRASAAWDGSERRRLVAPLEAIPIAVLRAELARREEAAKEEEAAQPPEGRQSK